MSTNPTWPALDTFYEQDECREHSVEVDLPGTWYMEGWDTDYRLRWLRQTGELVAVAAARGEDNRAGRVELLAWVATEKRARKLVSGWATQHGQLKSFYWLRKQVRQAAGVDVVPGGEVLEQHRRQAGEDAGSLF